MGIIRITAKKDGFRRAGIVHRGSCAYPEEAFTPEQLTQLERESLLIVERVAPVDRGTGSADVPEARPGKKVS